MKEEFLDILLIDILLIIVFGTIDCWLIWEISNEPVHRSTKTVVSETSRDSPDSEWCLPYLQAHDTRYFREESCGIPEESGIRLQSLHKAASVSLDTQNQDAREVRINAASTPGG